MFKINTASLAFLVLSSSVFAGQPPDENSQSQQISPYPAQQNTIAVKSPATFTIVRFRVLGNTLLDARLVDDLLLGFTGSGKGVQEIQQAQQALEDAYRQAGYTRVRVLVPPQEIKDGTVTLTAIEFKLGHIAISGNQYHDNDNILSALPALVPGKPASSSILSKNLRLANENPSRHLDLALAMGNEVGTVDARVNVQDAPAHKILLTFDNTGNSSTGQYRVGLAYQNSNLFDRDHAATLSYTTSPDHIGDVKQISASYRLPLYSLGDSLDAIAAYTDTNAGTTNTVAGPMSFSGKGHIGGIHYNHYFAQTGEYTSLVTGSLDYRAYTNNCSVGVFGSAACGSAAANTTVHPVSFTYAGSWNKPSLLANFSTAVVRNLSGGAHGGDADFAAARPSPLGMAGANANYTLYQLNGSLLFVLPQDWRLRFSARSQYTHDALISGEQIGLTGMNTVRGYKEREASRDKGYIGNIEVYTPNIAPKLGMTDDSLQLLAFVDHAKGWNVNLAGETDSKITAGNVGIGARYENRGGVSVRFDVGRAGNTVGTTRSGDWRGHLSLLFNL